MTVSSSFQEKEAIKECTVTEATKESKDAKDSMESSKDTKSYSGDCKGTNADPKGA